MEKKKKKNQFSNLTKNDWKQTNESSKQAAGLSGITFENLYGEKTKEKVDELLKLSEE